MTQTSLLKYQSLAVKTFLLLIFTASFYACSSSKAIQNVQHEKTTLSDSTSIANQRKATALFSDGLAQRLAGNDQKAIETFQKALELYPADHASMYELSELYARKAMLEESLQMMKQAVELNPENEWYHIRLAQLYRFQGDYQSYANVYRNLLKIQPEKLEYFSELSTALLMLEQYDEALAVYDQIEKQIGINETLALQRHSIQLSKNDIPAAILEIERLSDAFPWEAKHHLMLAELYMKHGPREKVLNRYQKVLEIDNSDPYVYISMAEYYREMAADSLAFESLIKAFEIPELGVETKVQVMLLWFENQTFTEELNNMAEKIGQTFIRVHPDSPRGFQLMADVHMRRENHVEARNYFLKALEKEKNNYLVWESLLFMDIQLEDFNALGEHAREAILLFPEQPLPYYFSGVALYREKKWTEALKVLETGRKFVVGNDRLLAEFFSNIGDVQNQLKDYQASDASYDKALAINPANAQVLNNYAYYLSLRNERLEKANEMSKKSLEIDPYNPSFLDTYAWILYKQGDYESALKWIEKAVQLADSLNGTLLEHQGDILFKLGRKSEAVEKWKAAKNAGETSSLIEAKIKDKMLYE